MACRHPTISAVTNPSADGKLTGVRVLLTRAGEESTTYKNALTSLGASVDLAQVVTTQPQDETAHLDREIRRLPQYDWLVLTSRNTVQALLQRCNALGIDPPTHRPKHIAAIGPATRTAIVGLGWSADLIPARSNSGGLLEALIAMPTGTVLLPQSNLADDTLIKGLTQAGFTVQPVVAYETVTNSAECYRVAQLIRSGNVDVVVFTSPSSVKAVVDALDRFPSFPRVVCIGAATERACASLGLRVAAVAASPLAADVAKAVAGVAGGASS